MAFLFTRKEKVRSPEELVGVISDAFDTVAGGSAVQCEEVAEGSGRPLDALQTGAAEAAPSGSSAGPGAGSASGASGVTGATTTSSSSSRKLLKAEARATEDLSRFLHQLKVVLYGDSSDSEHHKPAGEDVAGVRFRYVVREPQK